MNAERVKNEKETNKEIEVSNKHLTEALKIKDNEIQFRKEAISKATLDVRSRKNEKLFELDEQLLDREYQFT